MTRLPPPRGLTAAEPIDDRDAFAALVAEHQRAVFFHALRLARGDAEIARDMAQRTFMQAWSHRAGFRGESSERTWLLTIAHHLTINELQRAHRRREFVPTTAEGEHVALGRVDADAPERLIADEERTALRAAMDQLSPRQREVALLRIYEDRSFAEIGTIVGITVNNAKVAFHHATQALRRLLAPGGAA